jgi:chromosome segregation ATPase
MHRGPLSDLDASFRQRLGSRIERHVLRSAVDLLDDRGTELDAVDRELQRREANLAERTARAEAQENDVEHRDRRLAELGADDISGQPRIDHLIRQLDRAEAALGQVRADARQELAAADECVRELQERELREHDDKSRLRAQELEARHQGQLAHERRLAERERRVEAAEAELRRRVDSLERREREVEERERSLSGRDTGWWNAEPAPRPSR